MPTIDDARRQIQRPETQGGPWPMPMADLSSGILSSVRLRLEETHHDRLVSNDETINERTGRSRRTDDPYGTYPFLKS